MIKHFLVLFLFINAFVALCQDIDIVIIDMDSNNVWAGLAGSEQPSIHFPNVVGYSEDESTYVGEEAVSKTSILSLVYPIQEGKIQDFDAYKQVLSYVFEQLEVEPKECCVLLTYHFELPESEIEDIVNYLFEELEVPGLSLHLREALGLYASGRTDGVFVYVDYDLTSVVPIFSGEVLFSNISSLPIGKKHMAEFLSEMLKERGYSLIENLKTYENILAEMGYVIEDYETTEEMEDRSDILMTYTLPDGQEVVIGTERFKACEILLQPNLIEVEEDSLHECIANTIKSLGKKMQAVLFQNIVLGGNVYPGLDSRLRKEIVELIPKNMTIKVVSPPEHSTSVWIGGAIMAPLATFKDTLVSYELYTEKGLQAFGIK